MCSTLLIPLVETGLVVSDFWLVGKWRMNLGLRWDPPMRSPSKGARLRINPIPAGDLFPGFVPLKVGGPTEVPAVSPHPQPAPGLSPPPGAQQLVGAQTANPHGGSWALWPPEMWALPRHRMVPGVVHGPGCRRGHSMGISRHIPPSAPCSAVTQQLSCCTGMLACYGMGPGSLQTALQPRSRGAAAHRVKPELPILCFELEV